MSTCVGSNVSPFAGVEKFLELPLVHASCSHFQDLDFEPWRNVKTAEHSRIDSTPPQLKFHPAFCIPENP